jgi:hypothetical protein
MNDIQLLDLDQESFALIEADLDSYCAKHGVNAGKDGQRTR